MIEIAVSIIIIAAYIAISSIKQKCSCGSIDFEYILPGIEESKCCKKCGKNYYSTED